jgi:hypothetical protein
MKSISSVDMSNGTMAYFKRSCHPAVFGPSPDECAALPFLPLFLRVRVPRLASPLVSANPRDEGNMSSPTPLTFLEADSGSELYTAEGDGGRLDRLGGGR